MSSAQAGGDLLSFLASPSPPQNQEEKKIKRGLSERFSLLKDPDFKEVSTAPDPPCEQHKSDFLCSPSPFGSQVLPAPLAVAQHGGSPAALWCSRDVEQPKNPRIQVGSQLLCISISLLRFPLFSFLLLVSFSLHSVLFLLPLGGGGKAAQVLPVCQCLFVFLPNTSSPPK